MKLQKSMAVAPFVAVLMLTACVLAACSATDKQTATEGVFTYEHDPRENPKAMNSIMNAICFIRLTINFLILKFISISLYFNYLLKKA